MKQILTLVLALTFCTPTLALEVESEDVAVAAPAAERLSVVEELRLRFRKALAEVTLYEMRKNDWLLSFAGADAGTERRRVVIALGDTVSSAALLALMGRFAAHEWAAARAIAPATLAELRDLREINLDLQTLMTTGMSDVEWLELADRGITPMAMREEIASNEVKIARLSELGELGRARRIGRGVALVVLPALAIGVVADLRSVWLQISMDSAQREAKRAALEDFVRSADTALRHVSR